MPVSQIFSDQHVSKLSLGDTNSFLKKQGLEKTSELNIDHEFCDSKSSLSDNLVVILKVSYIESTF